MLIPKISEESPAKNVGTTQSKASFFLSRFRELDLIDYGPIRVHKSLLKGTLHGRFPGDNAVKSTITDIPPAQSKLKKLIASIN